MWQVQVSFLSGHLKIWVAKLNFNDPVYEYATEAEALSKCDELQAADTQGRQYRIVKI